MSTPEPRALTEACSMCPETLVAFTDTELTEQLSLHVARHHNGATAAVATPERPTMTDAVRILAETWSVVARCDVGVFGGLQYVDALSIAQVLHAGGYSSLAGEIIYRWARNDTDWDDRNDPQFVTEVNRWIALIEPGILDRESSAFCQHYIDTGLYLTEGETL